MTEMLDVLTPRKRKDKTFWLKIGAAFVRDGGKIGVELDALPLPDETGRVSLLLSPPRPKTITPDQFKQVESAAQSALPDQEIPF